MSKQCIVTKKSSVIGYNVSHSKRRTKRWVHPNLQKHRLLNPATGHYVTAVVSASGLRTLAKWDKAGRKYDLRRLSEQL
ncbi:MAG TPA: 50S ribosomal protein L28 [Candidatus Kerfeldbacteria bacterium]|nr:50S ribosomal protein L28 [Candidatus Kerfeldbacteria bacterium]